MPRSCCARAALVFSVALLFIAADTAIARGRPGGGGANRSGARAGGGFSGPSARNFTPSGPPRSGSLGASGGIRTNSARPNVGGGRAGVANNSRPGGFSPNTSGPRSSGFGAGPGRNNATAQQLQGFLGGSGAAGALQQSQAWQAGNGWQHGQVQNLGQALQQSQAATQSDSLQSRAGQIDKAQLQQTAQSAAANWQNGPQPFSPAWYAQHPNAWQATHPYADNVAIATAATVSAWITYGAPYPATGVAYVESGDTYNTYVVEETAPQAAPQQPVPAPPSEAESEEWLHLGVYGLAPQGDEQAALMVQLAVNRQGQLAGSSFDPTNGEVQNVVGLVDPAQQQATWRLEEDPSVSFTAPLASLTEETGAISVATANGAQAWTLTRQE
ncbi:hypothetical protein Mal64_11490 [Pseudobythopirellula maris]|uniref:Uncharacterized protein n=1 Tax=Pseudobythopirellula maris TaxID=2527991 RepID=A0A5C5ZTC3_9BACT|nr:hypothetical protein [Pseudobythopirellula maris]TWT90752.1 hypothetical protein Mal64_11490 [Pseudobythopirellula maris]